MLTHCDCWWRSTLQTAVKGSDWMENECSKYSVNPLSYCENGSRNSQRKGKVLLRWKPSDWYFKADPFACFFFSKKKIKCCKLHFFLVAPWNISMWVQLFSRGVQGDSDWSLKTNIVKVFLLWLVCHLLLSFCFLLALNQVLNLEKIHCISPVCCGKCIKIFKYDTPYHSRMSVQTDSFFVKAPLITSNISFNMKQTEIWAINAWLWLWCIIKLRRHQTIRPTGASCLTWKWLKRQKKKMDFQMIGTNNLTHLWVSLITYTHSFN